MSETLVNTEVAVKRKFVTLGSGGGGWRLGH